MAERFNRLSVDRERMLETLARSEERYDLVTRSSSEGFWDWNIATGEVSFSARYCELLGYDPTELAPHLDTWRKLLHPEDREPASLAVQAYFEQREPFDAVLRVRTKSGEYRWFRARCEALWDPSGKPVRLAGSIHDVSAEKQAQETLSRSEERFSKAFHANPLAASIARASDGRFIDVNSKYERDFGWKREELIGRSSLEVGLWPDEELRRIWLAALLRDGRVVDWETSFFHKSGESRNISISAEMVDLDGARCILAFVMDITARKQAESDMRLNACVFQHSGEAVLISDSNNRILAVNAAFTQLTGYSSEEILGKNPRLLACGQTPIETYREMWAALARDGLWKGEIWDRRKDGKIYPKRISISVVRSPDGKVAQYVACFSDISERRAAEERISRLAHNDALTGLFNRLSLQERLEQALLTVKREQRSLAVMFIDMDHFKAINDSLGHAVGDELLVEVSRRLRDNVRGIDIVARLGGDEFVLVLSEVQGAAVAARVADKILCALGLPYRIHGHDLHSSSSIGIALFPNDGDDVETLMKNADTAMYHAKARGRNNVQFFTAAMNQVAMERLQLDHDLRVALEQGQFELHYQPQLQDCAIRDSSDVCANPPCNVVGVEALVRWRHPRDGLISPLKFIPIAEETGLILSLGEWVLNEACRQLRVWREAGLADVTMAVNLSALQLRSSTLLTFVEKTLHKHGLTGTDLELEITESVVMDDPEASIGKLQALRNIGVTLCIDDFGTGYSSLSYLKRLPIHTLKLDQSFVREIETEANDVAICSATIALAHNLGLTVVAEGVETQAQRAFLSSQRCDFLQGYLFSKPVPADLAQAFIMQRNLVEGTATAPGKL